MNPWPKPDPRGPGQESVWDYPRPPRHEDFTGSITIDLDGQTIASTTRAWRVLETGRFWHDRGPRPERYLPFTRKSDRDRRQLWEYCADAIGIDGCAS
ncbi:MAG: hypothetical protein QOG14_3017 [Mycobacterium sp.]|nr:hypothetical protein [Mycobacterium sp.]